MIYEPKEDSYLLQKCIKPFVKAKRVLDMGSGSGILARAAIDAGAKEVTAADIDADTVKHLRSQKLQTVQSDLFDNVSGTFEVITFNPPYLPQDSDEDEQSQRITTGGEKGDEIILRFLAKAPEHLAPKGVILLLLSSLTPKRRITAMLKKQKMKKTEIASEKLFMEELYVWKITKL